MIIKQNTAKSFAFPCPASFAGSLSLSLAKAGGGFFAAAAGFASTFSGGSPTKQFVNVNLTAADTDTLGDLSLVVDDGSSDSFACPRDVQVVAFDLESSFPDVNVLTWDATFVVVDNLGYPSVGIRTWGPNFDAQPVDVNPLHQPVVALVDYQHTGTAQGGAASSITLQNNASAADNAYLGCEVVLIGTTGQSGRIITGYNGSSKVAQVTPDWVVAPIANSKYVVKPAAADVRTILAVASAGAAGHMGIDWAQLVNQNAAANLSATSVGVVASLNDARLNHLDDDVSSRMAKFSLPVNANVTAVNGQSVRGSGTRNDPWGPVS